MAEITKLIQSFLLQTQVPILRLFPLITNLKILFFWIPWITMFLRWSIATIPDVKQVLNFKFSLETIRSNYYFEKKIAG